MKLEDVRKAIESMEKEKILCGAGTLALICLYEMRSNLEKESTKVDKL